MHRFLDTEYQTGAQAIAKSFLGLFYQLCILHAAAVSHSHPT